VFTAVGNGTPVTTRNIGENHLSQWSILTGNTCVTVLVIGGGVIAKMKGKTDAHQKKWNIFTIL